MNFSEALTRLKAGAALTRTGWHGGRMFVYLVPGSTFRVEKGRPLAAFWPVGASHVYHPHLDLWTGVTSVPWTASQTDLLADDWCVIDPSVLLQLHEIRSPRDNEP